MLNTRMVVTRYGGPEVLEVIEEPLRKPEKGEVRIKVISSGVALADIMRREAKYPASPAVPFIPGYDAVGIIDEVGEEMKQFAAGDQVAAFFNGTGGYASYVYAQEDELIVVPDQVDAQVVSAALLNYVSAYQMLHRFAKVSEGDRVLIHGASGGTGTAFLELGRLAKLEMFGTASAAKHDVVSGYGAVPIDYRNEDFVEVLSRLAPEGLDAVFDPIGGSNYERSLQTLSPGGRFIGYGYTSVLADGKPEDWAKDWSQLASMETTEKGNPVHLYTITGLKRENLEWFREDARAILGLLAKGAIVPLISHRVPLREAVKAQGLLEQSLAIGKVILINE